MNASTKVRLPFVPAVICVVFFLTCSVFAAPRAELWARWQQRDPKQTRTIDHRLWDTFVHTYVETSHPSGINCLRYACVTAADRQALRQYLSAMQAVPISTYSAPEQKAYWINLYNALTVSIVLEHYPVASIRDIDLSRVCSAAGRGRPNC